MLLYGNGCDLGTFKFKDTNILYFCQVGRDVMEIHGPRLRLLQWIVTFVFPLWTLWWKKTRQF